MKEMIKKLIDDGWEWVACDKDGDFSIFSEKPFRLSELFVIDNCKDKVHEIPSCLFHDITFENSPIELKTLLVDDEVEE